MTTEEKINRIRNRLLINNFSTYSAIGLEIILAYQALTLVPDSLSHVIIVILEAMFATKNIKEKKMLLERLEELLKIQKKEKDDNHSLKLK